MGITVLRKTSHRIFAYAIKHPTCLALLVNTLNRNVQPWHLALGFLYDRKKYMIRFNCLKHGECQCERNSMKKLYWQLIMTDFKDMKPDSVCACECLC